MKHFSTKQLLPIILIMACFQAIASTPDKGRIDATLESLRLAVNAHEYTMLEPFLDDAFTYQGRGTMMSTMIMRQVVNDYPHELSAIRVLSISPADEGWDVTVRLESAAKADNRQITISSDYRIRRADIADIQIKGHAQQADATPAPAAAALPDVTTVPFELVDRLIVVQAEVNGVFGNYIVDSGAPTVMLNQTRFAADAIDSFEMNHAAPKGAGGAMTDVKAARGLELSWGAIRMSGLDGLVTDLTHLEENLGGIELAGLIGFNVLEQFQVYFDYAAQELTLIRLDGDNRAVQQSTLGKPDLVVEFELMMHVPVLPVRIAGLDLKMGLDSGAAGGMIFTRWQDELRDEYEFIKRDELTGADHNVQMGDVVRIPNMQFGDLDYNDMTFRFNDLAGHGDFEVPFDGLLGYEFLKTRPTAINFRARELTIWPAAGLQTTP